MLISTAYAAAGSTAQVPGAGEAFFLNMLLIVILVVLFYVLLIMPQQKRFKQHRSMLDELKKGDKVLLASGFIATISDMKKDSDEVTLDMGNKVKMTALRSAIQNKMD